MENTMDNFVGRWRIIEWLAGPVPLLKGDIHEGDFVFIEKDSPTTCCLRWSNGVREFSANRPLAFVRGELRADDNLAISTGAEADSVPLSSITAWLEKARLKVNFERNDFGDGNVGTIVAEADPGVPPLRRWLRNLFRRR